jgi:hypothetical protein
MKTTLLDRIEYLHELGMQLQNDADFRTQVATAHIRNPFFVKEFVEKAVDGIVNQMLQKDLLIEWTSQYSFLSEEREPKTIGIIMAGNIPLVGFHDFLCAYISGNNVLIKLSSKDETLFPALLQILFSIDTEASKTIKLVMKLEGFDAVIATGSNTSHNYFEYYFSKYPRLLRKNRNSVAVLNGNETDEELNLLADDIFMYFGLGCRNVSALLLPEDYDVTKLFPHFQKYNWFHDHNKYMNNYDYQRSILLLNRVTHFADDKIMLLPSEHFAAPMSVVNYSFYSSLEQLKENLDSNVDKLQCVVMQNNLANSLQINSFAPFGKSQSPGLSDYADGEDVLLFLGTTENCLSSLKQHKI